MTTTSHVLRTYARGPELFTHGAGCELFTEDGTAWLDMLGGIAVSALGHGHPKLVAALQDQAAKLLHVSNLYSHPLLEPVSDRLCAAAGMAGAFFANSGAEANEAALKLARAWHKDRGDGHRTRYLALEHGFHGRTMGALSVTAAASYREPFEPLVGNVGFLPLHDTEALAKALDQEPAALILEPIQGEGGIRPLGPEYLRLARQLCTATGTVLIHDEVQSGCGRTGTFLAGQGVEVQPDLVTLAKPLGAGLPIGALLVTEGFTEALQPGRHGSTFGGGPMALRAAQVVLEQLLDHGLQDAVVQRGEQLARRLAALAAEHPGILAGSRGRGLMQAVVCRDPDDAPRIVAALGARHVLTCAAGPAIPGERVVRFLPPYTVTSEHLDSACDRLADALTSL